MSAYAYTATLASVVGLCARRAGWVLAAATVLTSGLLYFTATHLGLDTNTEDMLSNDLAFRRQSRIFDAAFPELGSAVVVVVDGPRAPAHDAAVRIADRLRARADLFASVYRPGGGPFFDRNGLLYLDLPHLQELDDRLAEAAPFLGAMDHDPTLRGLFTMLARALERRLSPDQQRVVGTMFDRISTVVENQVAGRESRVAWDDAWQASIGPGEAPEHYFVLARPGPDADHFGGGGDALDYVRAVVKQPDIDTAGVRARITGSLAMENEELAHVSHDGKLVTVTSFSLVCLLLFAGLRSAKLVVAIVLTLCFGLAWTAAFAAVAIGHLNLISVSFAVLFIGMGVDFGIQFGMRYREEPGPRGETPLRDAARGTAGALALAASAAAISFAAFYPTDYRGLAELGLIAAAGMVAAYVANLTVLPALIAALGVPAGSELRRRNLLLRPGELLRVHRRVVLGCAGVAAAGAAALLPATRFDFNPLNLRDPTTEAVSTFKSLLREPGSSPYTIDVLAPDLDQARRLVVRLEKLDEVDKALTLASYVPAGQPEKLEIIDGMRWSLGALLVPRGRSVRPGSREQEAVVGRLRRQLRQVLSTSASASTGAKSDTGAAVRERFADRAKRLGRALDALVESPGWPATAIATLEPRLIGNLAEILDRLRELLQTDGVTLADLPAQIRRRYLSADGRARIEVFASEDLNHNAAMRRFVAAVRTITTQVSGSPVSLVEGGDAVVTACIEATLLSLAATAVLMLAIMRSLSGAVLVLVPLGLAIGLTAASSVILDLPLNLANIIALPLLIGLSNAFGVYLIMRKRDAGSVTMLFAGSTPSAVLFSGLTTMLSFGSLALARHPGLSHMGILISLALVFALLSALLVLPALLSELDFRRQRRRPAPGAAPTLARSAGED